MQNDQLPILQVVKTSMCGLRGTSCRVTLPGRGWCNLFRVGLVVVAGRGASKEGISAVPVQADVLPL